MNTFDPKTPERKQMANLRAKKHYENNKEYYDNLRKEKYDNLKGEIYHCELCNRDVQLNSKRLHLKTKIHLSNITI